MAMLWFVYVRIPVDKRLSIHGAALSHSVATSLGMMARAISVLQRLI